MRYRMLYRVSDVMRFRFLLPKNLPRFPPSPQCGRSENHTIYLNYIPKLAMRVSLMRCLHDGSFSGMMGLNTSHTAIEAIGGLNLPGGGGGRCPPFEKTLRGKIVELC